MPKVKFIRAEALDTVIDAVAQAKGVADARILSMDAALANNQTLVNTVTLAAGLTPTATYASIPTTGGIYRIMTGDDTGQVWERAGSTLIRRVGLEAATNAVIAQNSASITSLQTDVTAAQAALVAAQTTATNAVTNAATAQTAANAALASFGNTALAQLSTRSQSAGPQFMNGSRWLWQATGTADGATIVAAATAGFWARETDGVLDVRWCGAKGNGTQDDLPAFNLAYQICSAPGTRYHTIYLPDPPVCWRLTGTWLLGKHYVDVNHVLRYTNSLTEVPSYNATNFFATWNMPRVSIQGSGRRCIIWADYADNGTPAIYYGLVSHAGNSNVSAHQGRISDFTVVGRTYYSRQEDNSLTIPVRAGESVRPLWSTQTGLFAPYGLGLTVKNVFFQEIGTGYVSCESYWAVHENLSAWRCGHGFRLIQSNASGATMFTSWYCDIGQMFSGQQVRVEWCNSQNCDVEIQTGVTDNLTMIGGYLETPLAAADKPGLDLGLTYHGKFIGVHITRGTSTPEWGIWLPDGSSATFESCRTYSSTVKIGDGALMTVSGCDGANWMANKPSGTPIKQGAGGTLQIPLVYTPLANGDMIIKNIDTTKTVALSGNITAMNATGASYVTGPLVVIEGANQANVEAPLVKLGKVGGNMSFYGVTPVAKPTVSGKWSDGTAGKSLAAALVALGLITDNSTLT